jgi:drug/metabolite transporter (DMT)-like permease
MPSSPDILVRLTPTAFVLLWSSGFVVAKFAAPYADPLTFIGLRYALAALAMAAISVAVGAIWPRRAGDIAHGLIAGILLHAGYTGGVWWAVAQGLPAGIAGLIAGLQPLLTALLAEPLLGERISPRQWTGIAAGALGIVLVLAPQLAAIDVGRLGQSFLPILVTFGAVLSVTLGTFYQKRFVPVTDLRTSSCLQFAGAFIVTAPLALATESLRFEVNATTLAAVAWSVLMLSLAGVALLLAMIRRGAVSRVASLIYLMAPLTAVQAFVFFGEALSAVQMLGIAVTALGVWLATHE